MELDKQTLFLDVEALGEAIALYLQTREVIPEGYVVHSMELPTVGVDEDSGYIPVVIEVGAIEKNKLN